MYLSEEKTKQIIQLSAKLLLVTCNLHTTTIVEYDSAFAFPWKCFNKWSIII